MEDRVGYSVRTDWRTLVAVSLMGFLLATVTAKAQLPGAVTQLTPSANQRYLVDQKGDPFLLQGDAAWSLIVATESDAEVEQYLENRRQKGFNTILVNLHRTQVLQASLH